MKLRIAWSRRRGKWNIYKDSVLIHEGVTLAFCIGYIYGAARELRKRARLSY